MTARSEERFPLIYSLHLDDLDHDQDVLVERTTSVSTGVSNILARWPANLSPTSRLIIGILGVVLITIVTTLIMFYTTSALVPAAFPIPRGISKRSADYCDFVEDNDLDVGDVGLWSNLLPLETQSRFIRDENRIFFVKRHGDNLTAENVCALKSADSKDKKAVYLIVLVRPEAMTLKDEVGIADEMQERRLDQEVNVMVSDPGEYFSETPLRGFYEDDGLSGHDLKEFAVKVVTVWRYGGAAYDLDLVTTKRSPGVERRTPADFNATISEDGAILIAREPCHAFVFELIRELARNAFRGRRSADDVTAAMIIKGALSSFCGGNLTKRRCNGVKIVAKDRLCSGEEKVNSDCEWARFRREDKRETWQKYCP